MCFYGVCTNNAHWNWLHSVNVNSRLGRLHTCGISWATGYEFMSVKKGINLHLLNDVNFNGYCWYTLHRSQYTPVNVQGTQNCPFVKIFFWKELIIIEKIVRRWKIKAMPVKSYTLLLSTFKVWKITRTLCKKLVMIKSVKFFCLHLVFACIFILRGSWFWTSLIGAFQSKTEISLKTEVFSLSYEYLSEFQRKSREQVVYTSLYILTNQIYMYV